MSKCVSLSVERRARLRRKQLAEALDRMSETWNEPDGSGEAVYGAAMRALEWVIESDPPVDIARARAKDRQP